jgi:hypothetical protein
MEQNLVGYLLGALDGDAQRQVEDYLKTDPAAQGQLDTLRRALAPLEVDKEEIAPPAGLAFRALSRVAEYRCRPQPESESVPAPPPVLRMRSGGYERRWWRRADVLVAASLFLVLTGLGSSFIFRARERQQANLVCQNNLRQFHEALWSYSDGRDGYFPPIPEKAPYNVAGMFVPQLVSTGHLGTNASLRCPGNGDKPCPKFSLEDLQKMAPEEFEKASHKLAGCYAYSLGYRDPTGQYCPLRRDPSHPDLNDDLLPIMADKPDEARGNSPNHGGAQNVLYVGGNVRYCTTPNVGVDEDNIYLNKEGKVAAGVNRWDTVLGRSADRP